MADRDSFLVIRTILPSRVIGRLRRARFAMHDCPCRAVPARRCLHISVTTSRCGVAEMALGRYTFPAGLFTLGTVVAAVLSGKHCSDVAGANAEALACLYNLARQRLICAATFLVTRTGRTSLCKRTANIENCDYIRIKAARMF